MYNQTPCLVNTTVINQNSDILPTVNGYYKVAPGTTVTIKKRVRTPSFSVYNDASVANLGSFSSYTQKRYDKSLTRTINRPISVERRMGSASAPIGISKSQTIGSGSKTHTLSR